MGIGRAVPAPNRDCAEDADIGGHRFKPLMSCVAFLMEAIRSVPFLKP